MLTKEVWLIKKNEKIALACLFFVVDVLIWCLSKQISVKKKKKYQELRDLGAYYFVSSTAIWDYRVLNAYKMNVLVSGPVGEKLSR